MSAQAQETTHVYKKREGLFGGLMDSILGTEVIQIPMSDLGKYYPNLAEKGDSPVQPANDEKPAAPVDIVAEVKDAVSEVAQAATDAVQQAANAVNDVVDQVAAAAKETIAEVVGAEKVADVSINVGDVYTIEGHDYKLAEIRFKDGVGTVCLKIKSIKGIKNLKDVQQVVEVPINEFAAMTNA